MARWVSDLPKPVGILACTDVRGRHVLNACRRAGVSVPEEAAVVGVDNDEPVCAMLHPTLSSVPLDLRKVGFRAAELLMKLLKGGTAPEGPVLVPPKPVVTRRSSDAFALEDEDVVAALRYIWEHGGEPISVEDVLGVVPMSRRSMEIRFKREIGRTPQKEIWRIHVERAKKLLVETDMAMPQLAKACGFLNADRLNAVFKRETGVPPVRFRRSHQQRG